MPAKLARTMGSYLLMLALGSGIGFSVPYLVKAWKPAYATGDYSAYYPDKKTNVVLYGTTSCPYCIQARSFLRERNIAFIDHDVASSDQGRREFARLGKEAVPVILVGGRMLTGFNRDHLEAALVEAGHIARR
ncbi:mycoredoxin [Massilia sp. UYP11]|uniref:glutaredoxin family protein n=1 Tax=Massilia sp. UYP11 TaxID=1756385 RepID=UPI003D223F9E